MHGSSKRPRKNSYLEASEESIKAEEELNTLIAQITPVTAFQNTLNAQAFGVAVRVERGVSENEALAQVGLSDSANPSLLDQYCRACLKLQCAMSLADRRSYEMTAEDRGWPRRSHHTSHRISHLLSNTTEEYKPEKWFEKQNIQGVLVQEDKEEPWNSVYHPDVPQHGITIAISRTKDSVHINEYSPEMTFFDLVLKLIHQYPSHLGKDICPMNSLFVPYGRVIVCKHRETLQAHSIVDGTLIDFVAGVHNVGNRDCCAKVE